MWLDPLFWSHHFVSTFCRDVNAYAGAIVTRLLPTFDSIEAEADKVSGEQYERLGQMCAVEDGFPDMADAAEEAFEAGLSHYESMVGVEQAVTNLAIVGLYHLFEQQVMMFHREQVLSISEEQELARLVATQVQTGKGLSKEQRTVTKLVSWPVFLRRLRNAGVDVESLSSWPQVTELRLLANAIKHGEGKSSLDLRNRRPDLFVHPALRGDPTAYEAGTLQIDLPMGGEDIYASKEDLLGFQCSIVLFWHELGDAMIQARGPSTPTPS